MGGNKFIDKYKGMSIVSKATIWFMACSLIQKGLSFLTTPIFARLLTKEEYGLYTVYTSWFQILVIVTTLRLDYSVFNKGMSKYPKDRDGYTASMLGVTTIITTALLGVYLLFRDFFNSVTELNTIIMIAMFAELYVNAAASFWCLRERYDFKYKAVVCYTLLAGVVSSFVSIVAVILCESKGEARIVSNAVVHLIGGIVLYWIVFKRSKKFFSGEYSRFAISFNIPLIPHYFSTYLIEQSDRIMIQKLVNFEAAALYGVAYTVGGIIKIFTAAITNTLVPLQYRLLESKQHQVLNRYITTIMAVVAGMVIAISAVGPEIVYVLGGKEYLVAKYVIPPVAASVFFTFFYTLIANMEFYYDENKFAMKLSFVGAVVNVVLNFLLIPIFGYVVAAYTTLFSYMLYAIGHYICINNIMRRQENQTMNTKVFLVMGAGATILCVAMSVLYETYVVRYALVGVIMLIVLLKRNAILGILKKK